MRSGFAHLDGERLLPRLQVVQLFLDALKLCLHRVGGRRLLGRTGADCLRLFERSRFASKCFSREVVVVALQRPTEVGLSPTLVGSPRQIALEIGRRNTLLRHLVDLRAVLRAAKAEVPEALQHAIDRMAPALRFFRHGDGALALCGGIRHAHHPFVVDADALLTDLDRQCVIRLALGQGLRQRHLAVRLQHLDVAVVDHQDRCPGPNDDNVDVGIVVEVPRSRALDGDAHSFVLSVVITQRVVGTLENKHTLDVIVDPADPRLKSDLISRNEENHISAVGTFRTPALEKVIRAANADIGLDIHFEPGAHFASSDHYPFAVKGVPVVHFFCGLHEDYHGIADTSDKVDTEIPSPVAGTLVDHKIAIASTDWLAADRMAVDLMNCGRFV